MVLALTGLLGCHRTASVYPLRTVILVCLVLVWSARLGTFLFLRVWIRRKDGRFDDIRGNWSKLAAFWGLQAAWILLVSLPLILLNGVGAIDGQRVASRGINFFDAVGWGLWCAGFYLETVADHEKHVFSAIARADRTLPFITTGLWQFSRHPNYFGEIVLWCGVWLSAAQGLRNWSLLAVLFALVSPAATFHFLVSLSGIPVAEARDDRRYGKLLAYQQYKAITSPLIPIPPRIYAILHPRFKRAVLLERNTIPVGQFALPKMKPGSPIQYSTQSTR